MNFRNYSPRQMTLAPSRLKVGVLLAFSLGMMTLYSQVNPTAVPVTRFSGPTSSQPLALTADGRLLAVVNPDNFSVTFFSVGEVPGNPDRNIKLGKVLVGAEPNGVAFLPDGRKAYVTTTRSGTVQVLKHLVRILNGSGRLPWARSPMAWL